jgi:hypothetical protein
MQQSLEGKIDRPGMILPVFTARVAALTRFSIGK